MSEPLTEAEELQMGNDLLDALDLTIGGRPMVGATRVIPWTRKDPVAVASILMNWLHQAVGAHAREVGRTPHAIFHENWSKPNG